MSDFFQRLAERTLGTAAIVQPLFWSRFTPPAATREPSPLSDGFQELAGTVQPPAAPGPAPASGAPQGWRLQDGVSDDAAATRSELRLPQPTLRPSVEEAPAAETAEVSERWTATHPTIDRSIVTSSNSAGSRLPATSSQRPAAGMHVDPAMPAPAASGSLQRPHHGPDAGLDGLPSHSVSAVQNDARRYDSQQRTVPPPTPGPARSEQMVRRPRVEPQAATIPLERVAERPAVAPPTRSEPAVIQVTIGRLEVRANVTAPAVRKPPPKSPAIGLNEYLSRRDGGQR